MLSPEELKAVDNYRFAHRMPSRAAAVRELLHGLGAIGAVMENAGVKSRDYNVLTTKRFREYLDATAEAVHEEALKAFAAGEKEG